MKNKLENTKFLNNQCKLKNKDTETLIIDYARSISGKVPVNPDVFKKLLQKRGLNIDIDYLVNNVPEELI